MSAPGRIRSLDGLRGVAAAVVVVHHTLLTVPALAAVYFNEPVAQGVRWLVYSPLHLLWDGSVPVFVFFILSGFVVPLPAMTDSRFRWRAYFPQRLIRLYVPVWASLLLAYGLIVLVPRDGLQDGSAWMEMHRQALSLRSLVSDGVLVLGSSAANTPLWSLQWEIIFSLLLPLYVVAAPVLRRRPLVSIATLALLGGVGGYLSVPALAYLPMFGIGTVLATRTVELRTVAARFLAGRTAWVVRVGIAAVVVGLLTSRWLIGSVLPAAGYNLSFVPTIAGATLVVAAAVADPVVERVLNLRLVALAGLLSFSLYLVHEPIIVTLAIAIPDGFRALVPPVAIVLAIPVAYAFHIVVERPSHRLAKRVGRVMTLGWRSERAKLGSVAATRPLVAGDQRPSVHVEHAAEPRRMSAY